MRTLLSFILILGVVCDFKGQKDNTKSWPKEDRKVFEIAKEHYNKGFYTSAYEKYNSLKANHSSDLYLKYVMGICAIYINDKQSESETLLTEVKANNKNFKNIDYYFVLLYHKTYRFSKALELANTLLKDPKLSEEDKATLERIAFYCKNGNAEIEFPVNATITNLGPLLNTEFAEYAPVVSPEEESVIFTYRGKESMGGLVDGFNKPDPNGDYNEDILISKKINNVWQKPSR